ncbi:MAG: U32 family peptidase [Bacilli bacterium]|nr:U32 family peptidase [Bacilli bacterium]
MNKPELLSPAGNMDALKAAIHNGADAVYLSGKQYGARAYADNFTEQQLINAIKYAHIYDVKVYVTTNTLIYEDEIEDFVKYLKFLYLNGVDAVLMQDIGMISLIRKIIPDLEIHASTQTNNCNDETLQLFKELGIKRVVLARELSLKQINNLKTDIEKEVFIHGALCVSYSGCCLFSSLNGSRSGNRGKCAGPCRLPYTLIKNNQVIVTDGKYLLSTKELNTSNKIKELLKANIQSFKIEGRLKSKEYVGFVTKMYRKLIDENTKEKDTDKKLQQLFNRGFTEGHLFQTEDLLNTKSPNHIGIPIGKVLEVGKKIKIKLNDTISQNDGIRFKESNKGLIINKLYNQKKLLINKAKKNDIVYIDNKVNLKSKDEVLKTTDFSLNKALETYQEKKLKVNFKEMLT